MLIKITGHPKSTCTQRVIAILNELGLEFEIEQPEWATQKSPEYLRDKHPFGKIPVLHEDGYQIFESRAIVRYLAAKHKPSLVPADLQKLGVLEQFLSIEYSYFDPPFSAWVFEKIIKPIFGHGQTDPVKLEELTKKVDSVLDVYEKLLVGKDYLTGEYSIADIAHLPCLSYVINNGYDLGDRPNVKRWWTNISEKPAWKKSIASVQK
ncbi:13828_t:CDS:2 [Ambispora leptoticha]|uniref:glutathione transferase n=1 Tax=Ambispora leptoticha TaxID=144679 RepID=A0A9N9D4W9_9GLOM|nr:13828_t:CDS:2 [Ambispora leptoticha]